MAREATSRALVKERVRSIARLLAASAAVVVAVWIVVCAALGTTSPFYVVSGESMLPTLVDGDLVVVRKENFRDVEVGEVVVYRGLEDRYIVHRVHREGVEGGRRVLVTKGDNRQEVDPWYLTEDTYEGTVILRVPQAGHVVRLLSPPVNYILAAIVILYVIYSELRPKGRGKQGSGL